MPSLAYGCAVMHADGPSATLYISGEVPSIGMADSRLPPRASDCRRMSTMAPNMLFADRSVISFFRPSHSNDHYCLVGFLHIGEGIPNEPSYDAGTQICARRQDR